METVADRIRQKRLECGWSQTELASRLGYKDKASISQIENSGNDISMKKVSKIAKVFGVTPAYLMGWEDTARENILKSFPLLMLQNEIEEIKKLDMPYADQVDKLYLEQYSGMFPGNYDDLKSATDLYRLYQKASPEARKAVEVLLKFEPPQS